ncbi:MAG: T9SS type A sorting domain-containing protein [Bacteroidia bacterium]|nr:T9SS type A sorting domain-containing protein [Bacteroidia bacterium]
MRLLASCFSKVLLLVSFSLFTQELISQTLLSADGPGNTYELIESVLAPGYNPIEVPDCSHGTFGRHIDEVFDNELQSNVFRFFIHRDQDDDRCINFDRQRNEIKSYDQSPDNLLGIEGETVIYSWKFKLDAGFQPSSSFTHLHQIKAVGGSESSMPQITLTARAGSPENLELRYAESNTQLTLATAPLSDFKGVWVEATETITYGETGSYELSLNRISDNASLFYYQDPAIRMWKTGAEFQRPKWGIYRSLNNSAQLRDEVVLFADFSVEEIVSNNCGLSSSFSPNPLTHAGTGANSTHVSLPANSENINFTITGINSRTNGPSSKHYSELVKVSYVNGSGSTISYGSYSASNVSDVNIDIPGQVQSISLSLEDELDGNTGSTQMSISLSNVSYCQGNGEPCSDADNDGVCDGNDVCPGSDDLQDADGDGIPDGCDDCQDVSNSFPNSNLSHSGTGSSSTSINLANQENISFSISGIGSKTKGKSDSRYIEEVSISYLDGTGTLVNLGPFSGSNQNSANIDINGAVSQITVNLRDIYDGDAPNISISLSAISSCQTSSSNRFANPDEWEDIKAYPNPFREEFIVSLPINDPTPIEIQVYDMLGHVIYQNKLIAKQKYVKIPGEEWSPGLYFIKVFSPGKHKVIRLLKAEN